MFLTVENRRLLVIGILTIIFSAMALLNNLVEADWEVWIGVGACALGLVVFAAAYIVDREVYALIGGYVMAAILVLLGMTAWLKIESVIVPTYVLAAIALPFIIAWTYQQKNWGMLIPAYVLLAIVPILYMDNVNERVAENLVPAYVLTMIGLPFIVAYVFTRKMVWLIPGGTLLLVALSFIAVQLGIPNRLMTIGLPVAALLVGAFIILRAMMQNSDDREKI